MAVYYTLVQVFDKWGESSSFQHLALIYIYQFFVETFYAFWVQSVQWSPKCDHPFPPATSQELTALFDTLAWGTRAPVSLHLVRPKSSSDDFSTKTFIYSAIIHLLAGTGGQALLGSWQLL